MIKDKLEEVLTRTAEYNTMEKTLLKVAEECTELAEVMIKSVTKKEEHRPPMEKLTEEMGDVLFRIWVATKKLGNEAEVKQRVATKARQLEEWMNLNMYKGGI